jgi:hypothetical protein
MKLLTRKKKEKPNTGEEGLGSRRKQRENRVQLQAEEEEEDAAAPSGGAARRRLQRSVSMGSRLASAAREQRARLYIMRRCVSMLVRWKHD